MNQEITLWDHRLGARGVCLRGLGGGLPLQLPDAPLVDDPNAREFEMPMVRGQLIVRGAHLLEIPPLKDGFLGEDRTFTTCRNFQFGVAYFGPEGTVGPRKTPLFEL